MKAALITEKETISFFEFDDPDPDLDQVVVEITLCGICGTDIHGFNTPGPMRASICGHEWTGICLLYTSPSPRDRQKSRMPSSA